MSLLTYEVQCHNYCWTWKAAVAHFTTLWMYKNGKCVYFHPASKNVLNMLASTRTTHSRGATSNVINLFLPRRRTSFITRFQAFRTLHSDIPTQEVLPMSPWSSGSKRCKVKAYSQRACPRDLNMKRDNTNQPPDHFPGVWIMLVGVIGKELGTGWQQNWQSSHSLFWLCRQLLTLTLNVSEEPFDKERPVKQISI